MNADWAPGGRQPSDQTNRFGLWVRRKIGCYHPQTRSTFIIITQLVSWYSYFLEAYATRAQTPAKVNPVRSYPESGWRSGFGWLPEFNGISLSEDTSAIKFLRRSHQFFPEIWAKSVSHNGEESFKKFLDLDSDADDLTKFNWFFLVHRCICDKNFFEYTVGIFLPKLYKSTFTFTFTFTLQSVARVCT